MDNGMLISQFVHVCTFRIQEFLKNQNRLNLDYYYLEPPIINCEDEYMEAIIDKNMLRAKRWNGNANNIFLSGPGSRKGFLPALWITNNGL